MSKRLILWLGFAVALWFVFGWFMPSRPRPWEPGRGPGAQRARIVRNDFRLRPLPTPERPDAPGESPEAAEPRLEDLGPAPNVADLPEPERGSPVIEGDLFQSTQVPHLEIFTTPEAMDVLRRNSWGRQGNRPSVLAVVREAGVVYTNVTLHLKGAAGSFRPVDHNPALTLNFSKFAPGQTFHGLHKLSLNNSVQDGSFLTEKICRELFEAAGVPAPRAGHAVVKFNGRNLGLRVLVEGWGKPFLKRYFKDVKGNLYDGGFVQDITGQLTVNSGEDPNDRSDLKRLAAAARARGTNAWIQFNRVLDMDRFLSYMAMDIIVCDWDGYPMNRNNWRLFHDRESDKMIFMPHGMDQMFGVMRTTPECSILPGMQGMVANAVLRTPEGLQAYLDRVASLYTNCFKVDALVKRVDQLAAVIRPEIPLAQRRQHDTQVQWLKQRLLQRDRSLRSQLAGRDELVRRSSSLLEQNRQRLQPLTFDTDRTARLAGWNPRVQSGSPNFGTEKSGEGAAVLRIAARGEVSASWRTSAMLEAGDYRFEGTLRTRDVRPASNRSQSGAGLRISGASNPEAFAGTREGETFSHPFHIEDDGTLVEFVCELHASQGEVWFDTGSLKVVRIE